MGTNATNDSFAPVREAGTSAPNFEIDNDAIVERLTKWRSQCSFNVTEAEGDSLSIEFQTLPPDMDAFVRELYDFCPDLVDQGAGCVHEMVEMMEEAGEELDPDMRRLIEGIDFNDEDYGLEILKREIEQRKSIKLWWD